MTRAVVLPYGRTPLEARLPRETVVVSPPEPGPAGIVPVEQALAQALDAPVGAQLLQRCVRPGDKVVIALSDHTRPDPRAALLGAVLDRLPAGVRPVVAIASGTHGPTDLQQLGIDDALWRRVERVINHDGNNERDLVEVGTTYRGTPVQVHRCVLEADLLVATGTIKPHYFAGYGAGAKAIFPGLGGSRSVRINHRLKQAAGAVAGNVVGNPCRDDLEEAVALTGVPTYLLDVLVDAAGQVRGAVAGHLVAAFRSGARRCDLWFRVQAPSSRCVVVSDTLPLTGSLYQASKLVAAVAPLVEPGGTVVLAAECPEGPGPVETVNRAIYDIGLKPRLPPEHHVVLVSGLPKEVVAATYCEWAPSVEAAVAAVGARPVVLPKAGNLIVERQQK